MAIRSVPASFFGMVLGLVGLGADWRWAARLWNMPPVIGEAIMALGFVVWALLVASYLLKWTTDRGEALAEARHPVQCCFIGLAPASTALMGVVLAPYSHAWAMGFLCVGAVFHVLFSVWRVGGMLQGDRELTTVTPIIYLPSVAGNFIVAITAGTLGHPSYGILFLGAGGFAWLALESVIVNRMFHAAPLPLPLRPTFGIQLAPPVVAVTAWLAVDQGVPGPLVQATWGYGLFQLLLLIRLLPWITRQPFAASYWAFTFGLTAIASGAMQMVSRGVTGAIADIAPVIFAMTNIALAVIVVGTLVRMAQGRLLPAAPAVAPAPAG